MDSTNSSIEWSLYAEHYDAMCAANPSYRAMIDLVAGEIRNLDLDGQINVLDIGAGTGNLLSRLAPEYREASFTHLDLDPVMTRWAERKYSDAGLTNVVNYVEPFLDWRCDEKKFDLIVSTNALYAISPHAEALRKVRSLLKPNGHFIVVDFGRKQNTNDWAVYIAVSSLLERGFGKTLKAFRENWEVARQNRRTTAAQEDGSYWLHNTEQFREALLGTNFEVLSVDTCYRGYSDIAVCRKSG